MTKRRNAYNGRTLLHIRTRRHERTNKLIKTKWIFLHNIRDYALCARCVRFKHIFSTETNTDNFFHSAGLKSYFIRNDSSTPIWKRFRPIGVSDMFWNLFRYNKIPKRKWLSFLSSGKFEYMPRRVYNVRVRNIIYRPIGSTAPCAVFSFYFDVYFVRLLSKNRCIFFLTKHAYSLRCEITR